MRKAVLLISLSLSLLGGALVSYSVVMAEDMPLKTITLDVDNMTCRMCPYTVRKALNRIDGVIKTEAKYEGKGIGWAKVTFDPSKTNVEVLTRTTTMAGYPSRVRP